MAAFDIIGAKRAGYSDTDIADYLGGQVGLDVQGARQAGYSDQEIIGQLSGSFEVGTQNPAPAKRIFPQEVNSAGAQQVMGIATPSGMRAAATARKVVPRLAKDAPRLLAMGVDNIGTEAGQALDFLGAHDTGRAIKDVYQSRQAETTKTLDPETQRIQQIPVYDEATGAWNADVAPEKFLTGALQSAPDMAVALIPSTMILSGLSKLNSATKIASVLQKMGAGETVAKYVGEFLPRGIAGGWVEGIQAGLGNSAQTEQKIRQADVNTLQALPSFQSAYAQTDAALPEEQRVARARDAVANRAALEVFLKTVPTTAGLGMLTGGGASGMLSEKLAAKSVAGSLAKDARRGMAGAIKNTAEGIGEEAFQEGVQSPAEQYIQNVAEQKYLDPSIKPTAGLINSGVEGAGAGGLMGAVGGGATSLVGGGERTAPAPMDHESYEDISAMPAPSGPLSAAVNKYTPPAANLPVPVNTIRVTPQGEALSQEQYHPLSTIPVMSNEEIEASRRKISGGMAGPALRATRSGAQSPAAAAPGQIPAGATTDELVLDEARAWANDRIARGDTQYMRMVAEKPMAHDKRILDAYRKAQNAPAAPVAALSAPAAGFALPAAPVVAEGGFGGVSSPAVSPVTVQPARKPDPDQATLDEVTENDRENLLQARERAQYWEKGSRSNGPSNKTELFPWLSHWGRTTPAEVAGSIDAFLAGKKLGALQKQLVAEAIRGERERVAEEATAETPEPQVQDDSSAQALDPDLLAKAQVYAKQAGNYSLEGFSNEDLASFIRSWEEYQAELSGNAQAENLPYEKDVSERVQLLAKNEKTVPESEGQRLPPVRGEGGESVPSVDPELQGVSSGHGSKTFGGTDVGQERSQRGLRAGELPVGNGSAAGGKSQVLPSGDTQWGNHDYRGDGPHSRPFANDVSQQDIETGIEYRKVGNTDKTAVQEGLEVPDLQRADYERARVGTNDGDSSADTEGKIASRNADRNSSNNGSDAIKAKEVANEVSQVQEKRGQGKEEVPDLRNSPEGTVPGGVAGTVAPENNSHVADQHIPASLPTTDPVKAEGPATAASPAGQQARNAILPKHTIRGGADELLELHRAVRDGEIPGNVKSSVWFHDVSAQEADDLAARTGLDLTGYVHSVDSFAMRHALKSHGTNSQESARGQVALAEKDFASIPEVVTRYDEVQHVGKDNMGNELIRYRKRVNGTILYVEEVRRGKRELALKTMWKIRAASDASPSQEPPSQTSETFGRNLPHAISVSKNGEEVKNAKKVTDAGDELTHNRRNRVKRGLKWSDVEGMNDALKAKEVAKGNVHPKPDYDSLIADGMPAVAAHLVKQVYDSIAAKPQLRGNPTDADFRLYVESLHRVMSGTLKWASDTEAVAAWAEKQQRAAGAYRPGAITGFSDLSAPQKGKSLLETVYPQGWREHKDEIRLLGGNKVLGALQPGYEETLRAVKAIAKGWPGKLEAWQVQGLRIAGKESFRIEKMPQHDSSVAYIIRQGEGSGRHIAYFQKQAEADSFMDNLKPFVLLDKRDRIKGSFDTEEEVKVFARASVRKEKPEGPTETGMNVDRAERTGPARRLEGEDVDAQALRDTFGFRGVNFGNWMPDKERQLHLNHAYDSLHDLAEILNVPPKALSLDGMVGLAFGAQGGGQGAAAHFVPGMNEINLTRTNGAGSLAHEWAHALDHYFAVQAGLATAERPFLSETPPRGVTGTVRPEIISAFRSIVAAMLNRDESPQDVEHRLKAAHERSEQSLKRWIDHFKRLFAGDVERLAPFLERIEQGDYGDGYVAIGRRDAVYPVVAELRDLYKSLKGKALSKDDATGLHSALFGVKYYQDDAELAKMREPRSVATTYKRDATVLDKNKKVPYWSTRVEMFARAFDAFVSDEVEAREAVNSYLSHTGRDNETVPRGEERAAIDAAFKMLIGELKSRETERGVALFAREKGKGESLLSDVEFDAVFKRVTARLTDAERAAWFTVAQTFDELPLSIKAEAQRQGSNGNEISGVFHRGKVYLVRDRFTTEKWLEEVILHEWHGHAGLKGMFGADITRAMVDLYDAIGGARMFTIGKKHGVNLMQYGHAFARAGYDLETIRALHTEELLAHLTNVYSRGHIADQIKELIGRIRAWLREHGFLKLSRLGETDIAWLLKRARVLAESGAWQKEGDPVFISPADLMQRLQAKGIGEEDLRRALEAVPTFAAAWHGSPHSFEAFSTQAIGTGEGNQAYGYGLYFAGNKEVANFYKEMLSKNQSSFDPELVDARSGLRDALEDVDNLGFERWQDAVQAIRQHRQDWSDRWDVSPEEASTIDGFLARYDKRLQETRGSLYQVELAPEEDEYLLWDKSLSEQSEKVKEALGVVPRETAEQIVNDPSWPPKASGPEVVMAQAIHNGLRGADWYHVLSDKIGSDKAASERLHSLGIRGIKYLDGNSRGRVNPNAVIKVSEMPVAVPAGKWKVEVTGYNSGTQQSYFKTEGEAEAFADKKRREAEGNHNYVIFDDSDVQITARFALHKDLDQVSPKGLLKRIGGFLNPLDFSRFDQKAREELPESAKAFLGDMLQTPFWKKERDPAAKPFYDEFAEREVKRFDHNIRMFGGLVDQEGKKTAMEKLRGVVQWTDKVTRFGKLREDLYEPLSKGEKEAYDVLRFEGDAFGKVYGKLSDALRNPRIKAAGVNQRVFDFYVKAIAAERDSFEVKLQIVQENMEEAGMDPEKIKGHIAEHRLKYAEMEGWVHRDHGEGDHVVQVRRVIDRLDFSMDQVLHKGEEADRIRLPYYPGHALTKSIEEAIKPFGASFQQTRNGAIIMLFKKGDGEKALQALQAVDLEKEPGEFWKVLVYSRLITSEGNAKRLAAEVRGNLAEAMPRNFREGYRYETSWNFADKVQEYEFQALQTSDMELERVLTESLKKARAKGELSDQEYQAVQESVVQATAETLLGRGAGLYQIRRASYLIEGYDTSDAIGKYQSYVNGVAGMLSKARYALRQYKHLLKVDVKTRPWAFRYIEDSLRNMGRADRLSGDARALASIWYLGFSASWMLVNSTQPYAFGQAELSRFTKGAATKIALAERDVIRGKLTDEERKLFESEEVLTQERESFQAEMAGQLEGVGGAWSKALHGTARISMALGQRVEVLNRRTVILAAYRVFRAQGANQEDALRRAMELNSTVNIDMGRHNLPTWARKPLGRTLYTLQSYIMHALNYLYHRGTSGETRDQRAILRLLWVMMLMGGLPAGAPGSDELDRIIRKIFNYSPKLAFRGFTRRLGKDYGTAGEMLDGFIWHGIPGALKPFGIGFSLTGAIQFRLPIVSNVISGDDLAKTVTGPLGGLVQKGKMGAEQALRGDWSRAAEYLAPNALANLLSGIRQAAEGVKTGHGKPVLYRGKQLKMTPVEGAIRAAGFQPARTADISETRGVERELSGQWNERRQDALDEYRILGSRKGMQRFNRELRSSQASGLVSPLTAESLRRAKGGMNRKASRWEHRYGLD